MREKKPIQRLLFENFMCRIITCIFGLPKLVFQYIGSF